jgi:beta-lactamase class A
VALVIAGRTRGPDDLPAFEPDAGEDRSARQAIPGLTGSAGAVANVDAQLDRTIRATLGDEVDHHAVVVRELADGTGAAVNPRQVFHDARLTKLAVTYEAFRQAESGGLSLDSMLTITRGAAEEDLGTLDLLAMEAGDRCPVRDLVSLTVTAGDNAASVALRDALDRANIDRTMLTLGLRSTSMRAPDLIVTLSREVYAHHNGGIR